MNARRYSLAKMFNAILSCLYVLCGDRISLVMLYVAVSDVSVDAEAVISSAYKTNSDSVTIDCLQTVQWNSPIQ